MIVGLLANRSALSPNLIKSLIYSVADVAREDAEHSTDLQLFRVSFMALVNVVQVFLHAITMQVIEISIYIIWLCIVFGAKYNS